MKTTYIPVSIVIAGLIVGISLYKVQVNKQDSIERTKQAELQLEIDKLEYEKELKADADLKEAMIEYDKADCTERSMDLAVQMYKEDCQSNPYCTYHEGRYSISQQEDMYNVCLKSKGL